MTGNQTALDFSRKLDPISAPREDRKRLRGQNLAILERLRLGPATNVELAAISLKYTARISDIRSAGYSIEAKRVEGGIFEYWLTEKTSCEE